MDENDAISRILEEELGMTSEEIRKLTPKQQRNLIRSHKHINVCNKKSVDKANIAITDRTLY